MDSFTYKGRDFLLNGKKFIVHSGAMHYFRIPKPYWRDRLLKLKEMGFNCVETYLCWNLHEKQEGVFDFSDNLDFGEFLDIAAELGLYAIVRPGPYICAEWEFGGFPAWLLNREGIEIRCSNEVYLGKVYRYFSELIPHLKSRLISQGGNILMLQVENEYGGFGNDKKYMRALYELYRKNLPECLYFTSDGCEDEDIFDDGSVEGCLTFANFGSSAEKKMQRLGEIRKKQPLMCAEFWSGWFDRWHGEKHERDASEVCAELEVFLKNGYSFNMYMAHGGTNFGFMNGSILLDGEYQPTITSYDYSAPINEAGDRTETYYKIRELFEKYGVNVPPLTAKDSQKTAFGKIRFTERAGLFENFRRIGKSYKSEKPRFMEDLEQNFGYTLYISEEFSCKVDKPITLVEVKDRAIVYANGKKIGVEERGRPKEEILLKANKKGVKLVVLAENMGRNNFGPYMFEKKGLGGVLKAGKNIYGWECVTLPMEDLSNLRFEELALTKKDLPAFYKAEIEIDEPTDTFLKTSGFTKGFAVVNGFNLGRYYNVAGPQKTLFVPASVLKKGINEIILFESDEMISPEVEFVAETIFEWK